MCLNAASLHCYIGDQQRYVSEKQALKFLGGKQTPKANRFYSIVIIGSMAKRDASALFAGGTLLIAG